MTSTNDDDEIDLTVTEELIDSLQVTFWPGSEVKVTNAQPLGRSVVTTTLSQPDPQTCEPEQEKEIDHKPDYYIPLSNLDLADYIKPGGQLDTNTKNISKGIVECISTMCTCSETHLHNVVEEIQSTGICSFDTENKVIDRLAL